MNKAFEKFNTKKLVEDGAKIYLYDANGDITDEWLRIVNTDSKQYKLALAGYYRKISGGKLQQTPENYFREVLANCVIEWSFKEKCTPENVAELLSIAPQIVTQMQDLMFSSDFFKLAQASSSNGASDSSDSASATTKE